MIKLSNITLSELVNAAKIILVTPIAMLTRLRRKDIWLISERPDQARDNGYVFYSYLRRKHPEQTVYYLIHKQSVDYNKVHPLGETIEFDSWRHYFYFVLSKTHISAHVGGCNPSENPLSRYLKPILKYKDIFLPHGVSYGVSEFCLAKYAKIDLYITSGKPEYENVLANYGYKADQVVYTGFPRLDCWHHIQVNPHQIVVMPTWRLYLAQNPNTVFTETAYYKAYSNLINCKELNSFLQEKKLRLIFYLHHEMRKYVEYFQTDCDRIEVVYKDEQYDIQELLKESAVLITDYSSVHFDFAYMGKPVIYYQFDRDEFWNRQYSKSDFDAAKDGFGPVAYDQDNLLTQLKQLEANGFRLSNEYEQRMLQFYQIRDEHNCDRVYQKIMQHIR